MRLFVYAFLFATISLPIAANAETDKANQTAAIERRLHPQPVEASSFLWTDWNRFQQNYHPLYAADDDPKTAWVEGVDSSGAGQWIRFHVSEMKGATKLRLSIRAGYQKSTRLFKANARPRQVTVILKPSGKSVQAQLEDREGWQEIIATQAAGPLDGVELHVDSVYEGTKYTDLTISDVRIFVTATTRENPAYEKSKLDKTLAWKAERLRTARLYKQKKSSELPLLPTYRLATAKEGGGSSAWDVCEDYSVRCRLGYMVKQAEKDPVLTSRFAKEMAILQKISRDPTSLTTVKVAVRDKRPIPAVDGLHVPDLWHSVDGEYGYDGMELPILGTLGSLRADGVGALEVQKQVAFQDALSARLRPCNRSAGRIYAWAEKEKREGDRDQLRALLLVRCGSVEMREGDVSVAEVQIVIYGDDGRLALVAGADYVNAFTWAQNATANGDVAVIGEGRGLFADGRLLTLTRPALAQSQGQKPQ